jgi:hypothetical protein
MLIFIDSQSNSHVNTYLCFLTASSAFFSRFSLEPNYLKYGSGSKNYNRKLDLKYFAM